MAELVPLKGSSDVWFPGAKLFAGVLELVTNKRSSLTFYESYPEGVMIEKRRNKGIIRKGEQNRVKGNRNIGSF